METNSPSAVRVFKSVVAVLGSIAFFIASLAVALSARGYQVSGQPMPNGKGGFMTFREGYLLALILFLFSLVWFIGARRMWRGSKQK